LSVIYLSAKMTKKHAKGTAVARARRVWRKSTPPLALPQSKKSRTTQSGMVPRERRETRDKEEV